MRSALIIGGSGLIGSNLAKKLSELGWVTYKTSRSQEECNLESVIYYDLSDPLADVEILPLTDIVILCAGISTKQACEDAPSLAYAVNVGAPIKIAQYFFQNNRKVIFISSSAVFHGSKTVANELSKICPQTLYGWLKVEAERSLQKLHILHGQGSLVVVRPTKVFWKELDLLSKWRCALINHQHISAFNQVLISPISIEYLVNSLVRIAQSHYSGVFHLSGELELSFYNFACSLASKLGVTESLVGGEERLEEINIPKHALLAMDRTSKLLGITPQSNEELMRALV